MTKRDFDAVADVLKKYIVEEDNESFIYLAKDIANVLSKHHCGFDPQRFYLRCGFTDWADVKFNEQYFNSTGEEE